MSWRAKVFVVELALAVRVTLWAEVTADTVAEKVALLAPAGTTTDAGRVTALLLSDRAMLKPPVGADPVSVTVHVTLPAPVTLAFWHESALRDGVTVVPVPLRLTAAVGFVDELLVMVSCPVAEPAAVGLNCTVSATDWPALRVTGNVAPDTRKPVPLTVAALIVTGAVPVEVRVTEFVAAVLRDTFPNDSELVLTVNVGT